MDKNFIISNFKRWIAPAGLLAFVVVFFIDAFAGAFVPTSVYHSFNQNDYDRPGQQDYEALRIALDYPYPEPLDIVVLGSSRPRDGILPPQLKEALSSKTNPALNIVNYGKSGGRAFDFEVLAQRLVEKDMAPRLVVLPINPRFTQANAARDNLRFSYMKPRQLPHEIALHGLSAPLHLTEVLLSHIFPNLSALRQAAREWVDGRLSSDFNPRIHNPIVGGLNKLQIRDLTRQNRGKPITSIANKPPKPERIQKYVNVEWPAGTTHNGQKTIGALKRGLALLKASNVKILLMDLPMSPLLSNAFPENRLPEYRANLQELSEQMNIRLIPASAFPEFTDEDFREQSHLNRSGAQKLTAFVAVQIKKYFADELKIEPLQTAPVPSLGLDESFDAGNGTSKADAGVATP